jgi:hypothetical protein
MKPKKEFDLVKITAPILIHLLKDELACPRLFLLRCKLTLKGFKKSIDERFPKDFLDLTTLPLWVYLNLKEKVGQKKAYEIMRIAVLGGGVVRQAILFDTVKKKRTFKNFADKIIEINKTGTTRWNIIEVVDRSDSKFEIKVTKCLYHELSSSVGAPELTKLICQVDNAVFNSYLPEELIFHRRGLNKRIADGAKFCQFVWEYKGK